MYFWYRAFIREGSDSEFTNTDFLEDSYSVTWRLEASLKAQDEYETDEESIYFKVDLDTLIDFWDELEVLFNLTDYTSDIIIRSVYNNNIAKRLPIFTGYMYIS